MATLSDRLIALAQTIGADIKAIHHKLSGRLVVKDGSPINGWLPSNADDAGIAAGSIIHAGQSNTPVSDWTQMLSNAGASFGWQLASPWHHNSLYVRNRIATTFHPWRQIWDSGNSARLVTGDADPGAIGAGAVWVRTSHPMGLHVRNSDNSGWIRIGGGGMQVQKQQIFTTSGTFTPPPGMIAQGGHCEVLLVGGGSGGTAYVHGPDSATYSDLLAAGTYYGGDGGEVVKRHLSGVTATQSVVIGAGGTSTYSEAGGSNYRYRHLNGEKGGDSHFGNMLSAKGGARDFILYGRTDGVTRGVGVVRRAGVLVRTRGAGVDGYGAGGDANTLNGLITNAFNTPKNTGQGGFGVMDSNMSGGSAGICIVTWWEAAE
ncbi:MAG: hypothetical protein Q4B94_04395 [Pseudomonadota bacterium]|nr:hypothetical protein [Pseudomonadota bacterium]